MSFVLSFAATILRRHPSVRQFVKFCMVGAFNTLLDFGIYFSLTRGFGFWGHHLIYAAVVSFCFGATSSFILNNFWTFRCDGRSAHRRLAKFLTVAVIGMTLNTIIFGALVRAGVFDLIAKCFAIACVVAWNFNMQKRWTFNK